MSSHDKTLKLVTNLKRDAIEKRLAEARSAAQKAGLSEVATLLDGIEGAPKAQIEQKVRDALKSLAGKSGHSGITELLELVEMNLPNLK
ncbi:MAG: hypothetical protein ACRD8O_14535 [Bryobacteraceae bacterium]